jgi:hypothetical protein
LERDFDFFGLFLVEIPQPPSLFFAADPSLDRNLHHFLIYALFIEVPKVRFGDLSFSICDDCFFDNFTTYKQWRRT